MATSRNGKVLQVMGYHGLERAEVAEASAGDIVCASPELNPSIFPTPCVTRLSQSRCPR